MSAIATPDATVAAPGYVRMFGVNPEIWYTWAKSIICEHRLTMQKAIYSAIVASLALTFVMLGAPAPVLADGVDKKCLCRFQGQRYQLGEYACIRSKLARCEMFLNNTTWTFLDDSCGSVKLERLPRSNRASTLAALPQSN